MAADGVQRLDLKDLDAVLERAKAERWNELALVGGSSIEDAKCDANILRNFDWPPDRIFYIDQGACAEASNHIEILPHQIGNAGAKKISRLKNLTSLLLRRMDIGPSDIRALAELRDLDSLDLAGNQIEKSGVAEFINFRSLKSLNLSYNSISDAGSMELLRLRGLKSLDLTKNSIGDMGAVALTRIMGLSSLTLRANQISDTGATELAGLDNLTWLDLSGNTIGAAGARAILDAWADPATADRRQLLDLRDNGYLSERSKSFRVA